MARENEYDNLNDALINAKTAKALYLHDRRNKGTMKVLSHDISKLVALETLNVSGHFICELPESFQNLPIISLSIENNCFKKLPDFISKMPLERLYAQKNCISALSSSITDLKNLERIDLNYNEVDSIPAQIGNLSELTDFKFHSNNIKTLPESVAKLKKLESFDIGDNPLEELADDIFKDMSNLTYINLNNTNLKKIPESISHLKNLESLSISDNYMLTSIPESIAKLPKLKTLNLSGIDPSIVPESIKHLKLDSLLLPTEVETNEDGNSNYNPAKATAFIINRIEEFAKSHSSETFYAFSIDSGLLCLASEESFADVLVKYQDDYPKDYLRKKDIWKLKYNTGDWKYQGFDEIKELDKLLWPGGYDFSAIDKSMTDKNYVKEIIAYLQKNIGVVFKSINKTAEFSILQSKHKY